VVSLDLSGVEKKDVEVNVSNGFLTISGEKNITVILVKVESDRKLPSAHLNGLLSLLMRWLKIRLKHSLRTVF